MAEMREQVSTLSLLVESRGSLNHSMEAETSVKVPSDQLKITKLSDQDDIEAYLVTFERLMEAYEVLKQRWAFKLVPQLYGRMQQAYASMPSEQCGNYSEIKAAILRRYDTTEETYRQRIRAATRKEGETYRKLATRLMDLANKWTKECTTVLELREMVVTEQQINVLPRDIQIWVRERKPRTSSEAG